MALTQDLDSGEGNATAVTFTVAAVDTLLPDGVTTAKIQPVALIDLQDDGNGGYYSAAFLGTQTNPLVTSDLQGQSALTNINDGITALQGISNESGFAPQLIGLLTNLADTPDPITLTDNTLTTLYAAPLDGSRLDLSNVILTNTDTSKAFVDFICGSRTTTVIVDAESTLPLNNVVRGVVDADWNVALQGATGNLQITAGIRIAPIGL